MPSPTSRRCAGTSACCGRSSISGRHALRNRGVQEVLLSCLDEKSGGFANEPGGKPDVVLTAVGLMVLVELKVPTKEHEAKAIAFMAENAKSLEEVRMAAAGLEVVGKSSEKNRDWINRLLMEQRKDGTFGDGAAMVRDTGSYVACLLRLGAKVDGGGTIVKMLDAAESHDGAFAKPDEKAPISKPPTGVMTRKLRMGRLAAHPAEIVGRIHQPRAEMIVPHAICDGAPCQHVVRISNPAGQRRATAPSSCGRTNRSGRSKAQRS